VCVVLRLQARPKQRLSNVMQYMAGKGKEAEKSHKWQGGRNQEPTECPPSPQCQGGGVAGAKMVARCGGL